MDGNKTRFWKDIWHEKGNMEDLFPDIYNLIMFQQSTIADLWSPQGWNFIFRRNLNDWEIVRVAEFLNTVNTFTGLQLGEDKLWWTGDDKGVFKVNKSYKLMDQTDQQCSRWPWKQIWKSRIPHKVSFFVWSMAKEAVLTQDNVMKRGRTLCSRCFLCGETSETVNHLFLHCKYTHHLWRIFLSLKGISWTMPRKVAEALLCWEEAGVHAKDRAHSPVCRSEKEMNRRKDMLANLKSKVSQMASTLNMSSFANRDSLLGPEIKPVDAMSRATGLDNYGVVGLQRQIMKEQDEGLESLEETVMSTKHIALAVNEELGLQTRLIDDLDEHVDVTDSRLQRVQRKLGILNKRTKGGCSCMCMLLAVLGIVILVVAIYMLIKYL
ncbi:hypothetical protein MTR67_033324 [Solanum verrucosum]|uniref:t-SNARE coiled-coil homology domain-containing protein n=1 Tax=Solanum verrucosum TaxID=315347 RepID=A0AAF0U6A9_SOLVR|nr:hypothetical protein MTR67_033324 [Solanum verrucosum]